jgi:anti-sigma regulatory factor (Ser/Thr protein kinase)
MPNIAVLWEPRARTILEEVVLNIALHATVEDPTKAKVEAEAKPWSTSAS